MTKEIEQVSSKKWDVFLLDDDPVMDVYNLSFDELQRKIVQMWSNHFPANHMSPAFIKERVIVSDVRKHPTSMADATFSYAGATSSNVKFVLVENEQMTKNL